MPRQYRVLGPILMSGDIDANFNTIGNLPDVPVNSHAAANKAYVDGRGLGAIVAELDGEDPSPILGVFTFQLEYAAGQPASGSITFTLPFAEDPVDITIPATLADDGALADILDAAIPDQYQTVFGTGADTFAQGRAFVIVFLAGFDHMPLDLDSPITVTANTLAGGTPDDPVLIIPDASTPGNEGIQAALGQEVIDVQGEFVWKKMLSGFVQTYPPIS